IRQEGRARTAKERQDQDGCGEETSRAPGTRNWRSKVSRRGPEDGSHNTIQPSKPVQPKTERRQRPTGRTGKEKANHPRRRECQNPDLSPGRSLTVPDSNNSSLRNITQHLQPLRYLPEPVTRT